MVPRVPGGSGKPLVWLLGLCRGDTEGGGDLPLHSASYPTLSGNFEVDEDDSYRGPTPNYSWFPALIPSAHS